MIRDKYKFIRARRSFSVGGVLAISFLFVASGLFAQPLPPDPGGGNPVPVGGAIILFAAVIAGIGIKELSKKKKQDN